ncbi:hypothetical protein BJ165DRAFT_1525145 [Panaeolus papilionaceus]|nr:hypothetical protein BJ165DRAFT_1525145 [Panaeolus papilionaceus]
MDDFDDYIVDDIVFDDQTLAALDQQEQQYFAEGSNSKSDEPANKRLKIEQGWSPAPVNQTTIVEDESLPEISLQGDGTYGLSNLHPNQTSKQARQGQNVHNLNNAQYATSHVHTPAPRLSKLTPLPKHVSSRPPPQRPLQAVPPTVWTGSSSFKYVDTAPTSLKVEDGHLAKALDEISQLRAEYARLQAKLQETQEARIMKEGEVGVLRRSIEKNNQTHAAQLAQFKREKEKAEARQAEMQKEQQELEATNRKLPTTSRAKKIGKELPATPAFGSTQAEPSSRRLFSDATPLRVTRTIGASPNKVKGISPQKSIKAGTLPGFHNAFDTSTPIRSQIRRINKGKERQNDDVNMEGSSYPDIEPLRLSPASPRQLNPPIPIEELPPFSIPLTDNMTNNTPAPFDSDEEVMPDPPFEGINWKALMAHMLLTYSHPSSEIFVFQRLLSIAQTVDSTLYIKCCSRIMEVIANPIDVSNFTESLKAVCNSLLTLAILLNGASELQALASVFNLCTKLIFAIPGFTSAISTSVAQAEGQGVMSIIHNLILDRLQHNNLHQDRDILAHEILLFLESLAVRVSAEASERVKPFLRNRECLIALLHPSQPHWLLERAGRLLCIFSYHHSIYRDIMNIDPPMPVEALSGKHYLISYVHILWTLSSLSAKDLRIYILTFFSQLSVTHTDARAMLVMSHSLIPSIIIYLTQLTAPLWEDDERLISSTEETLSLVRTTNQATLLLHNLIFDGADAIDLRHRLQNETARFSSGIFHMFIVTLGRLSYCEPPSWLNREGKQDLENISELSRDILEIVVDGPEVDNVWAAFQVEQDDETDEDDMEAKLLGVDGDP